MAALHFTVSIDDLLVNIKCVHAFEKLRQKAQDRRQSVVEAICPATRHKVHEFISDNFDIKVKKKDEEELNQLIRSAGGNNQAMAVLQNLALGKFHRFGKLQAVTTAVVATSEAEVVEHD